MPDPNAVNSMFGRIAHRYDLANRLLSFGVDVWWRFRLVRAVSATAPSHVLDLATGSGDVAFALAAKLPKHAAITGMDFCQPMLDQAEAKKQTLGDSRLQNIVFRRGDGLSLPLEDHSVDAVTIAFGLRNMADRHRCLSEIARVLKPGGSVFILEFSQPYRWFRPIYLAYLRYLLPRLAGWITGDRAAYSYLNDSIEAFPGRIALSSELEKAGFTQVRATALSFGIVALHRGTVLAR